jgi:hypothetical protein
VPSPAVALCTIRGEPLGFAVTLQLIRIRFIAQFCPELTDTSAVVICFTGVPLTLTSSVFILRDVLIPLAVR